MQNLINQVLKYSCKDIYIVWYIKVCSKTAGNMQGLSVMTLVKKANIIINDHIEDGGTVMKDRY